MAAATVNGTLNPMGLTGLTCVDLTFAASADTYASGKNVRSFMWSVYDQTGTDATTIELTESAGTFTLTINGETGGAGTTDVKIRLWIIEQK